MTQNHPGDQHFPADGRFQRPHAEQHEDLDETILRAPIPPRQQAPARPPHAERSGFGQQPAGSYGRPQPTFGVPPTPGEHDQTFPTRSSYANPAPARATAPAQPSASAAGPSLASQLSRDGYVMPTTDSAIERDERPRKQRGRGAVVALSLLLPLGIILGAVGGYFLATNVNSLDNKATEDAVAQVLRDEYGLSDLRRVDCPNWIRVEQNQSFQCEFEYAGGTQTVTVTQGSQSGQLIVGAPE